MNKVWLSLLLLLAGCGREGPPPGNDSEWRVLAGGERALERRSEGFDLGYEMWRVPYDAARVFDEARKRCPSVIHELDGEPALMLFHERDARMLVVREKHTSLFGRLDVHFGPAEELERGGRVELAVPTDRKYRTPASRTSFVARVLEGTDVCAR